MNTRWMTTFAIIMFACIYCSGSNTNLSPITVADKVVSTLRSAPSMSIKVIMRTGTDNLTADLTLAKEKFTFKSGTMTVLYDGTTQWTVDAGAGEVSITTPTAEELAETNPLAFLQNYKKNYKVEKVAQSSDSYTIVMSALRKSSYVRTARVIINTKTWLPTQITALLSTGQNLTINVIACTKGSQLPITYFRLNQKAIPSYEIIDLR